MYMLICPTPNFASEVATNNSIQAAKKCTDTCLIRNHALFCCISVERFENLLDKAKILQFSNNSLIYGEGERANKFYYILKGNVKTYRTTQEGEEHLIDIVRTGQLLAEPEIFDDNNQYHSFAETIQATEVISFSIDIFRDLVQDDIHASHNLLVYFSKILKQKNYDLEILINCPARQRVLIYFRELVSEYLSDGKIKIKRLEIKLPMPKCQLAARLAMKPETLSRVLSELRSEGLIVVDRQKVVIEKLDLLIDYTS